MISDSIHTSTINSYSSHCCKPHSLDIQSRVLRCLLEYNVKCTTFSKYCSILKSSKSEAEERGVGLKLPF